MRCKRASFATMLANPICRKDCELAFMLALESGICPPAHVAVVYPRIANARNIVFGDPRCGTTWEIFAMHMFRYKPCAPEENMARWCGQALFIVWRKLNFIFLLWELRLDSATPKNPQFMLDKASNVNSVRGLLLCKPFVFWKMSRSVSDGSIGHCVSPHAPSVPCKASNW